MIIQGDCLLELPKLEDNSVDSIVCDPPYELGFMGKKWDNTGIAYNVNVWKECLRVLKPGGHLLAFGGCRTYHRMAVAIEDAGFEVRDMLEWIYASGFPKSLSIGKAVDKLQGNKREELGRVKRTGKTTGTYGAFEGNNLETKGNSEWEGFGTNLKPSHEPICMARKPLQEKTIVEQVLKTGTGAICIDGCRIPTSEGLNGGAYSNNRETSTNKVYGEYQRIKEDFEQPQGRFPANIIVTDDALNDGVMTKSSTGKCQYVGTENNKWIERGGIAKIGHKVEWEGKGDSGSKSRYFDIDVWAEKHGLLQFPKASKRERNEGCEGLEAKFTKTMNDGIGEREHNENEPTAYNKNHHPTVKPVHLMSWLVRLVTPKDGTCLDPFMGSGTTGVACKKLGIKFIGIELVEEYCKIAEARINSVKSIPQKLF